MMGDDYSKGTDPPRVVYAVIETPLGSRVKYAASDDGSGMRVSKLLAPTFAYPANTGYFTKCLGEDGDPLDAMVLGDYAIAVGAVASVRPIAVMRMVDRGERDDKVICVLDGDPAWDKARGLADIPRYVRDAFDTFHSTYRKQEGTQRSVKLQGWAGVAEARRLILAGYKRFEQGQGSDKTEDSVKS